jgi:pyruvate,orthophosphate dikinase
VDVPRPASSTSWSDATSFTWLTTWPRLGETVEVNNLLVLMTLRYKGRADAAALAAAAGVPDTEAEDALATAVEAGQAAPAGRSFKLSDAGKAEIQRLQAQERDAVDPVEVQAVYDRFCEVNGPFKAVITAWQLRDGSPNDHADAAYDADVVARLVALHAQAGPVLADIGRLTPRFARYPARFEAALQRVQDGDPAYIARPITDSYHTIWFELHEDLIALAGLTRADEAAAGRAH